MLTTLGVTIPKKQYALLGKLLTQKEPEIAQRLITTYISAPIKPHEIDLAKLPAYFNSFCTHQQIDPENYKGPLYKSSKIDQRRLFISCMLRLYNPGTRLLAGHIASVLMQKKCNTSRMIEEVEVRYRHIAEFRQTVDRVVKILKNS